ncbi:MAG: VWA domain-containing protein [Deltaproteobacteria bacterium]|nr:VWA domain-containing protein [Deltaproteobacteria bacterium]TLN02228.1 MAG: VWA domain-containing protein [bacterium]
MNLEYSGYLWLLLVIPFFLYFSLRSYRTSSDWLYRFARIKKRPIPYLVSTLFLSLALAAVIFSLAAPKVQYHKSVFNRSGIDVAIGIDVSKSMLAEDEMLPEEGKKLFTIPNRLNRARYSALTIISALKGERVGVFMFARKGVAIIPLTTDYGYCQYILKHFNDATIAIPGSDLNQAIVTGISLFDDSPRKTAKTIILISDGEDISADKSLLYETAQRAAAQGITIYTVGTGMGRGALIPIRDSGANIEGYYQSEEGDYLKTRLEQDTLQRIAATTGGRYFRARDESSEENLVDAIVARARTFEYSRATELAWFNVAPIMLGAALGFFCIGIIARR